MEDRFKTAGVGDIEMQGGDPAREEEFQELLGHMETARDAHGREKQQLQMQLGAAARKEQHLQKQAGDAIAEASQQLRRHRGELMAVEQRRQTEFDAAIAAKRHLTPRKLIARASKLIQSTPTGVHIPSAPAAPASPRDVRFVPLPGPIPPPPPSSAPASPRGGDPSVILLGSDPDDFKNIPQVPPVSAKLGAKQDAGAVDYDHDPAELVRIPPHYDHGGAPERPDGGVHDTGVHDIIAEDDPEFGVGPHRAANRPGPRPGGGGT